MKRSVIGLLLGCASIMAQVDTDCKDSISNANETQYLCMEMFMDDWRVDSLTPDGASDMEQLIPSVNIEIWTFYVNGTLAIRTNRLAIEKKVRTGNFKISRGWILYTDVLDDGSPLRRSFRFQIYAINKNRIDMYLYNDDADAVQRWILKRN